MSIQKDYRFEKNDNEKRVIVLQSLDLTGATVSFKMAKDFETEVALEKTCSFSASGGNTTITLQILTADWSGIEEGKYRYALKYTLNGETISIQRGEIHVLDDLFEGTS